MVKVHEKYIKRCIELAKNGLGTTYPNPLVGCVIVHQNKIIGEGWHRKAGEPHAEVHAVNSVKDRSLLSRSTLYVNLEPCSHYGKTPPCCDLIAAHQIPDIVIGTIDPFAKVAGNGIKKLKDAGRNVMVGILETECGELNKRFFTFHQKKRPYIILKWAESRDGFIAPETKQEQKPVWITDEFSRQMAHKWRTEEQAILVGTKTVIDDNPRLNARDWAGTDPVRIVLDQHNRIPKESHIFDNSQKTILISDGKTDDDYKTVIMETIDFERNIADEITTILFRDGIQSVIIEGGRQTLQTFIDAGIWDEARIFKGNIFLGNGTKAPEIKKYFTEKTTLIGDELLIFSNHD